MKGKNASAGACAAWLLTAACATVPTSSSYLWSEIRQDESKPLRTQQIAPNFTLEQLATNVYAFISNNTTHTWQDGNTTVVVGDRCVAVVDAPANYLAKLHLAEIKKITSKPVCYVINTHSHRDHVLGNYVYKDAFPNALIFQQEYTARISDRVNPAAVDALKGKSAADQLKQLQEVASTGVGPDGNPLTGYDLERAKRTYAEEVPVLESAAEARYVSADITFADSMTIKIGGTELQLQHMVGHTFGDTVVWLSKEKILITGDLVIAPVPYGGGSKHYDEWADSLDRLIAFDAKAIVPGHGEVEFSNAYMALERDLFRSLTEQAVTAVTNRASLDDFKKSLDLKKLEAAFVHGDPELKWGWDNYLIGKGNVLAAQAYGHAHGDF
jgi:glyoxylase-like metal-dependent hydrolase (beta-lactamase superfamily II)